MLPQAYAADEQGMSLFFNVPEYYQNVGIIDQQKEKQIGEKVYREVQKQLPVLHDLWLEQQLLNLFSQIYGHTRLGPPIALVIINDPQINAFAVPGGLFALNTGLIKSAKNFDEIAGVIAHEVAHISQRHYQRSQDAFKGQGWLALAGILAGAAIATQSQSDAGMAVMLGTQAALIDRQLAYSRDQEREADRIGMQYMAAAGYNPESMADFFETMDRATIRASDFPDFWLTHPLTSERISEARLRARQYPKVTPKMYDPDFQILKWYTLVQSDQTTEQDLQAQVAQNNLPAQLALSAFYIKQGDYTKAQIQLDHVKKQFPSHALVVLLQTDIYIQQNKLNQAFQTVVRDQRIYPENRALSYKLAEVFIRQGKASEAKTLIQRFVKLNNKDIEAWRLLQQAAYADKTSAYRTIDVLKYRAEVEFWSGDEVKGIKTLLHAQRLATDPESSLRLQINRRLAEMQSDYALKI